MAEFLNMSGYGAYVWSCYGLALVVLVWNAWRARAQLREELVRTKRRIQMSEGQSS